MSLSNNTQTVLRTQYYDDYYAESDTEPGKTRGESFDFQRVLFRPKFPVQSRELTQLQTLLQVQLERLGKSEFRDGEAVLGGQLTLDTSVYSGQVLPTTNLVAMFSRTANDGKYVFDTGTVTTKAHVLQFVSADEGETSNNYLIFKPQTGTLFLPSAVVQASDDASITATFAAGAATDVFQKASIISIDEGVFFLSGFFVRVKPQTIVLNPFSDMPTYRIGLQIDEQVLDEQDAEVGSTLLDPANQNAPGAHRFRIKLTLAKKSLNTSADASFIELARVVNGIMQMSRVPQKFVRMDEMLDILARRTYDEAGDYIVKPFTPVIENDPNDSAKFFLTLGPGKAYVHGYEVQTTEPVHLEVRKGRSSASANNRTIPTPVGNFVYAVRVAATNPSNYFANTAVVDLHCVNVASILTTSSATYNNSRIGQAKVRILETFNVTSNISLQANNSIYRLYFYDVVNDTLTGNVVSASANGAAITLVLATANGVPLVNGAIEGVTMVLAGASSPVSGTCTVNNHVTANATHSFITLKEFLPTLPNSNTTYRLLFQLKDIDAFALYNAAITPITAPLSAKFDFQADVDVNSKISGTPIGPTEVEDTNDNVLLYQVPEKFIQANTISTNSAIFTAWLKSTANARAFGGAANTAYTVSVQGSNFSLPAGSLTAATAQQYFIVFDQTVDTDGNGRIIQFADAANANSTNRCITDVSVTQVGSDYNIAFTYRFGGTTGTTRSLVALAKTTVTGFPVRQKTLVSGNTTAAMSNTVSALDSGQVEFHTLNASSGFAYSLKAPDVFRIKKVLYKASNTAFANTDMSTATDVTSYFTLDNGQRDNTYEYARLVAGSTASAVIRPTGRLLVIFDWFKNTGRGYASVDSYLSSTNLTNGMTYDIIPDYTSVKFNRTVNLRDVLDFRPVRSNFEYLAAAMVFAASDAAANNTYLTTDTASSYLVPVSDGVWLGSYNYYLGRIDKIGLSYDGQFKIIEGQDAVTPTAPENDGGALLLFQLRVPAYTLVDANNKPTSVLLTTFDHKRYTMQDLSKMEDRVAHLEYYTALNSLERITKDTPILDASDNERFKNGIVVDNFHSGGVADMSKPEYTASIDIADGELHTAFNTFVVQFAPDTANSTTFGISLVGDMAIPSYNVAPFITQPLATHAVSVNPFDVASFYGTVKLSPAVDIWKSVTTKPAQVIDLGGPTQSWVDSATPPFVNWGEWQQTWSGVVSSVPRNEFYTPPGWTPENHEFRSMTQLSWNDVTTATTYQRQGTQYEYTVVPTTQSIGNRVLDVSVVHRMRARDIVFDADGLKPGSNLYAFFDGTAVTQYIQQGNVLQLETLTLTNAAPFYVGQTVYIQKPLTGNAASTSGANTITGTSSKWDFELVAGQLVRIKQGVTQFDAYITNVASNTSATLSLNAPNTLATATLYTLTPVTIAQIGSRITGSTVVYTVKVVRAQRDADNDQTVPYPITAGCLRPDKMVLDGANTTTGAWLIIPPSPRYILVGGGSTGATINITSAICRSGVVRAWNNGTGALRFDTDIQDSAVATVGTKIRIVAGPGAGTYANVVSYTAANQTAILDNTLLTITPGQSIYSVGTMKADGFIANSSVTSGRAGTGAGVFHLQEGSFATGSRLFRLTDEPTNNVSAATTAAEKNYDASGIAYQQQETSVTSRSVELRRAGPVSQTNTTFDTTVQGFNVQYVDPLAETFLVDNKQYPLGVMITSLDVCFAGKPDDDIPVILEIRSVVNGYPSSNEIVPCVSPDGLATVSLRPDAVKTSTSPSFDNPATVTTFQLPAPVHLLPGKEYAVVLRSDSNAYTVYTAELGGTVIGSDAKVGKQPYAGSFFKSQNASTWTESPLEDLMFRLNRAIWTGSSDTPQSGVLIARGVAPDANVAFDSYTFYPHDVQFGDVTSGDYDLDIKPMNQSTGDLTGQVAVRYQTLPSQWSLLSARSMLQGFGGDIAANNVAGRTYPSFTSPAIPAANTVDGLFTLTTESTDVAPFIDTKKVNLLCIKHLINDMPVVNTNVIIVNPGSGYLANLQTGLITSTSGSAVITGDANTNFTLHLNAGDTLIIGGNVEVVVASVTNSSQVIATANVSVSRSANTFWTYGDKGANNAVGLTITSNTGVNAAGYTLIGRDGKVSGVILTANGSGYVGSPTLTVPAPVAVGGFDATLQSQAVLDFAGELKASGLGNGLTRYITRSVTLADGFEARDLTVSFDAYRPLGSKFYVFYKVLPGNADTSRFDDQPWRRMVQETPDSTVSTNYNQFKQFDFKTTNTRALDATTDTTDRFKVFAIKVLMASSGTVDVPRITNFRAIALDT